MDTAPELKKLYWASRRGMLELDLLLCPFAREALPQLPATTRRDYARLLELDDPQLCSWLLYGDKPEDPGFEQLIARILQFAERA